MCMPSSGISGDDDPQRRRAGRRRRSVRRSHLSVPSSRHLSCISKQLCEKKAKREKRGSEHLLSVLLSSLHPIVFGLHDLHLDLPWICLGFALDLLCGFNRPVGGIGWLSEARATTSSATTVEAKSEVKKTRRGGGETSASNRALQVSASSSVACHLAARSAYLSVAHHVESTRQTCLQPSARSTG